jgi:hypothetical protein
MKERKEEDMRSMNEETRKAQARIRKERNLAYLLSKQEREKDMQSMSENATNSGGKDITFEEWQKLEEKNIYASGALIGFSRSLRNSKHKGKKYFKKLNSVEDVIQSGIYFLFYKGTVVYIGQSLYPIERIHHHWRTKKLFDAFRIMRCAKHRLRYWEGKLIYDFKPHYNDTGVHKRLGYGRDSDV